MGSARLRDSILENAIRAVAQSPTANIDTFSIKGDWFDVAGFDQVALVTALGAVAGRAISLVLEYGESFNGTEIPASPTLVGEVPDFRWDFDCSTEFNALWALVSVEKLPSRLIRCALALTGGVTLISVGALKIHRSQVGFQPRANALGSVQPSYEFQ